MFTSTLVTPFLLIKIRKKTLFLLSGTIATLSQALGMVSYSMYSVMKKNLNIPYFAVAIFKHLEERLSDQEKDFMLNNLAWIPMAASILVVTCTGCFIQRHKTVLPSVENQCCIKSKLNSDDYLMSILHTCPGLLQSMVFLN